MTSCAQSVFAVIASGLNNGRIFAHGEIVQKLSHRADYRQLRGLYASDIYNSALKSVNSTNLPGV